MSDRLMRDGLDYRWPSKDDVLFANIDATGGWPIGFQYIGFNHSDEREAGFCNSTANDGWWTVVASADDYYLWKLSPKALKKITDAAVHHFIRNLRADTSPANIHFNNWRDRQAVIQETAPTTQD